LERWKLALPEGNYLEMGLQSLPSVGASIPCSYTALIHENSHANPLHVQQLPKNNIREWKLPKDLMTLQDVVSTSPILSLSDVYILFLYCGNYLFFSFLMQNAASSSRKGGLSAKKGPTEEIT
jgi:hypothetical protein